MPDQPLTQRDVQNLRETLKDLNTTIRDLRTEISTTYARRDVIEPVLASMQKDIDAHDQWLTWIARLVIGAVLLALLGLVIVQNGAI